MRTKTEEDERVEKLWITYGKSRSNENRNKLVEKYLSLAEIQTAKMRPKLPLSVDYHDIYQAAVIGLMQAVEHFDQKKGFSFKTFAKRRIVGAILDWMRSQDWIPRNVRTEQKKTGDILPSIIGFSHDDFKEDHSDCLIDKFRLRPDKAGEVNELKEKVKGFIEKLPRRQREVAIMFFYENLPIPKIAKIMGITEGCVSADKFLAISRLRKMMRCRFKPANELRIRADHLAIDNFCPSDDVKIWPEQIEQQKKKPKNV